MALVSYEFPEAIDSEKRKIAEDAAALIGGTLYPTGSRIICPSICCKRTDWDFVALVPNQDAALAKLEEDGWDYASSGNEKGIRYFESMERRGVNLILTDKKDFRDRFLLATQLASGLGLTDKYDRIRLFQAVLYGTEANWFTALKSASSPVRGRRVLEHGLSWRV